MKKFINISFFVTFIFCSCHKNESVPNPSSDNSFGTRGQVYFNIISQDSARYINRGNVSFNLCEGNGAVWQNACYDIEKQKIIWIKNDSLLSYPYTSNVIGSLITNGELNQSFRFYEKDNYMVRIFPSAQGLKDCDNNNLLYTYDGIYFEKVNKFTGAIISFKKIVPGSELAGSNRSGILRAVYDGASHLFISCVKNNTLYCVDTDGNIVWQKPNYTYIKDHTEVASVYFTYQAGKIIYCTDDNIIRCLDANTGVEIWHKLIAASDKRASIVATDKYVFYEYYNEPVYRTDLNTGTATERYYTPNKVARLTDFHLDASTVIFEGYGQFGLTAPDPSQLFVENRPIDFTNNNEYANAIPYSYALDSHDAVGREYKNNLYRYTASRSNVQIDCIDLNYGEKKWQISATLPASFTDGFTPRVYTSFFRDDVLYLLANFRIINNQVIATAPYRGATNTDIYGYHFTEYFGYPMNVIAVDVNAGSIKGNTDILLNKTSRVFSVSEVTAGN